MHMVSCILIGYLIIRHLGIPPESGAYKTKRSEENVLYFTNYGHVL